MSADPFVREAREDVERLSEGLVALEAEGGDREAVDDLFRRAHSLKGSLGMEGYDGASDLAHAIEDLLDAVRAGEADPEGDLVDRGLDAVDALAAMLDEVERTSEPTTDHDATAAALRSAVADARPDEAVSTDEPDAVDDTADGEAPAEPDIADVLAEADAEANPELSAEEALEAASTFDDLDALAAEVDDEEAAAYEGLAGGGSMPSTEEEADDGGHGEEREAMDADESPDEQTATDAGESPDEPAATDADESTAAAASTDDPDEPADPDDGDTDAGAGESAFASVKANVDDEPSVDELEAEIEAETFGEFDDDDDMSIDELVDLDPDEEPSAETEAAPAATEPVTPANADKPTGSAGDAPVDADAAADDGVPAGADSGNDEEFAWVRRTVEVEESVEELEAEIEAETFGEFDDDDDMSIGELIALDPDEEPPKETDLGAADVASVGTDGPEPVVSPNPDDGAEPTETSAAADTDDAEPASTPEPEVEPAGFGPEPDPGVEPEEPDAVTALAEEIDADRGEVAAVVDDLTGPGETADDLDPATVEAELADAEEELASIAAELDEVDLGEDEPGPATESGFQRDSELEAFESRFEGLFDRETDETRSRRAVGTLAESSVDPATYRLEEARDDGRALGASGDIQTLTVDVENADELLSLAEELSVHTRRLNEELAARPASDPVSRALGELGATTHELQRTVMDVRLMPLSTVTGGLARVVRDVTRGTDTEASLSVEGEDVRLDRSIIDRLGDPIGHLVRNAVDHGIEPADEREAAGKPREGTVELRARREGSEVVVAVEDDGRGVDVDAVFERAAERDLVDPDVDLTEAETLEFLFHPGFSTAEEVTKTSGRGVGLDVVRDVAEALNGDVAVETEPGEGTAVRLTLPVSVATLEVLFVEAGGERYALPMEAVEHVGREGGARIAGGGDEGLLTPELRGDTVDLAAAMGVEGTGGDAALVRVEQGDESVALRCDRVLNTRDVVISPYDDLLAEVPGLTGTTMTDDGRLVNVVDVERMETDTEDL